MLKRHTKYAIGLSYSVSLDFSFLNGVSIFEGVSVLFFDGMSVPLFDRVTVDVFLKKNDVLLSTFHSYSLNWTKFMNKFTKTLRQSDCEILQDFKTDI